MDKSLCGLKAGLEIHQQLDTNKLFCECPSLLRNDNPLFLIEREIVSVAGDTGKMDVAVEYEKSKGKKFFYEVYDTNCLVELDEEPPHQINQNALKIALQIAIHLNCKIFPVTQIMRKIVADGSNTSGFQRTALIGYDGYIETSLGRVGIETIAIEEDSARSVKQNSKDDDDNDLASDKKIYRLDRLGIPLVEITTKPDLKTPEQIKEAALIIGEILRSCKVKRGIGTIRQDVNISTTGSQRVEIKGFQDPKIMIKTVELEIIRQQKMIEIHIELKKRKVGLVKENILNVSDILKNTECKFISDSLRRGESVSAIKLEKFNKILGMELYQSKRFGTELSDRAKIFGLGGIIHSDENLKKYSFSDEEIEKIKSRLEINTDDAFIIIVGKQSTIGSALKFIISKINYFIENGVDKEVRKSNDDGTTTFLRPMPGESRMYPETDLKLLKISKEMIDDTKRSLPKLISENKKYLEEYGVNDELIKNILKEDRIDEFKYLLKITNNPNLVAKCLSVFPKEIASKNNDSYENVKIKLSTDIIESILLELENGKISENDVRVVLLKIYKGEKLDDIVKKERLDLTEEVRSIIKEKPGLSENAYMGLVMSKFKGMVNGKEVMEEIKKIM